MTQTTTQTTAAPASKLTTKLTPLLQACPPRPSSQAGDSYAADLLSGLQHLLAAPEEALDFLESTYLTPTTRSLLQAAIDRVHRGKESTSQAIYQLHTRFGGGKTHNLLLLAASARQPQLDYWKENFPNLQTIPARIVAFDGNAHDITINEQASPLARRSRSLAGHLLKELGGAAALEKHGNEGFTDPGARVFQELISNEPTIFIFDELVQYINRLRQLQLQDPSIPTDSFITTMRALVTAVDNSPRAIAVITAPEDAHELLDETHSSPDQPADTAFITNALLELQAQLSRQAQPMTPSTEADLPEILRRRLFTHIDEEARRKTAQAYADAAATNLRSQTGHLDYQDFYNCYPLHPGTLAIINRRLASNRNFQRVRGTLRLLTNALRHLQQNKSQAALLHPEHLTLQDEGIRNELLTRLGFAELDSAILSDITEPTSTSRRSANPELTAGIGTIILLGTLAPPEVNGLNREQIAEAILRPDGEDYGVITSSIDQFLHQAIHIDDQADSQRKRFSKDANVMKELQENKRTILQDTGQIDRMMREALVATYSGASSVPESRLVLQPPYPSQSSNVPDEVNRVHLGIINPDHWNELDAKNASNNMSNETVLELHRKHSGNGGAGTRNYPNNCLLLGARDRNFQNIKESLATREAARRLLNQTDRKLTADRKQLLEREQSSAWKNALSGLQNKYVHLFSAGNNENRQWPHANSHLEWRLLDAPSDQAGKGQETILQALGDQVSHGKEPGLSRGVWQRVTRLSTPEGYTLGELADYFARTPDMPTILNQQVWQTVINRAVHVDKLLHLRTPTGEDNPIMGYHPDWKVWIAGRQPAKESDKPAVDPPADGPLLDGTKTEGDGTTNHPPVEPPPAPPAPAASRYQTEVLPGNAAVSALKTYMNDRKWDWSRLTKCRISSASVNLPAFICSLPQSGGTAQDSETTISCVLGNDDFNWEIYSVSVSQYKKYAQHVGHIARIGGVALADVQIQVDPREAASLLDKLTPAHELAITAEFE